MMTTPARAAWTAQRAGDAAVPSGQAEASAAPPAPRSFAHGGRWSAATRCAPLPRACATSVQPRTRHRPASAPPVLPPPPLHLPASPPVLRVPSFGGTCPAALRLPSGFAAASACALRLFHRRAALFARASPGLRLHSRLSAGTALGATHIRAAFHVPGTPAPRASGSPPPSAATGPRQQPPPVAGVGAVQRLGRRTFRPAARANARQSWCGRIRYHAPAFGGLPVPRLRPARARWLRCRAGARHLRPAPAIQIPGLGASRLSRRRVRNPPPRCTPPAKPSVSFFGR